MKRLLQLILLSFALTANAGIRYEDINVSVIAPSLAPLLQMPDQSTVNKCALSLNRASLSQPVQERTATQQLANLLSNLIRAEQHLLMARQGIVKAEQATRQAEARAKQWLKPNVFGTINEVGYRNTMNAAKLIRPKAEAEVKAANDYYTLLMQTTADTVQGLKNTQKQEISEPLAAALQAACKRTKQSIPEENDEFNKELVGGLALLGMLWVGSKLLSEPSSGQATTNQDRTSWNLQQQQRRYADEEREQQARQAEARAISEQQARWRAESMRPFN